MSKNKISLNDNGLPFDATLLKAAKPTLLVLFAVGSGGNPERHLPLLTSLVEYGCTVIAPHFERLVSPSPSASDLLLRARRLQIALDFISQPNFPVAGVGHSIGATVLMALAGGQIWMHEGERLPIHHDKRIERLVLMASPTGFFQGPMALDAVRIPIQVWTGTKDTITPPAQAEFLKRTLEANVPIDMRVVDGAGHFSFMNTLPPQLTDALANREAFLSNLAADIGRFVTA